MKVPAITTAADGRKSLLALLQITSWGLVASLFPIVSKMQSLGTWKELH